MFESALNLHVNLKHCIVRNYWVTFLVRYKHWIVLFRTDVKYSCHWG